MRTLLIFLFSLRITALFAPMISASEVTWTNVEGGVWSRAANWRPNQIPTIADVAIITNGGNYSITLDVDASVAGLQLGGPTGNQTLIISGQSLMLNGPSAIDKNGFLSIFGGALGGSGPISVGGLVNAFSGSIAGAGLLSISTNGQMQFNGNVNLDGRAIENGGRLVWTRGDLSNGRGFTNLSTGTFDILSTNTLYIPPTENCVNAGTLRCASEGRATLHLYMHNAGLIQVQRGMLSLQRGGQHTGTITVASNATIALGDISNIFEFHPSSSVTGDGNVTFGTIPNFEGSIVNVNGAFHLKGTNTVLNGTVNFGTGYTLTNSPLILEEPWPISTPESLYILPASLREAPRFPALIPFPSVVSSPYRFSSSLRTTRARSTREAG